MATNRGLCPLDQRAVIDRYFLEHRSKILDIAAFLDRIDRAQECNAKDDFRLHAFRAALIALATATESRIEAMQMILSDLTREPLAERDTTSAYGACRGQPGLVRA